MFPLAKKTVCYLCLIIILVSVYLLRLLAERIQKELSVSVSQVVYQLIDLLRDGHPEDRVRGCYHALFLISETYSFPANAPPLGKKKGKENK